MRQPQKVMITWMPYPENKPTNENWYLIDDGTGIHERYYWEDTQWYRDRWNGVIAYAELPEGYKEDK